MKLIIAVVFLAAAVSAMPTMTEGQLQQQQPKVDIAKSVTSLQSIGHMAVVQTMSPLHVAISYLQTEINLLVALAANPEAPLPLPDIIVPKVPLSSIFTCEAKTIPKYSAALQFVAQHYVHFQKHEQQAFLLADGIDHVIKMIQTQQAIGDDTLLPAVAKKVNQFMSDYTSLLTEAIDAICKNTGHVDTHKTESDSPLSVFYARGKGGMALG